MDFLDKEKKGHFSTASKHKAVSDKTMNQLNDPFFLKQKYERNSPKSPDGVGVTALFCSALAFWVLGRRKRKVEALSGNDTNSAFVCFK